MKWTVFLAVLTPSFSNSVLINPNKKKGAGPLFQVHRGKRWGFMDRTGKIVISPQFENVRDFFSGLARVRYGDKFGYIDEIGRVVIPYQFDDGGDFSEALAPVRVGRAWGYIDTRGKFAIPLQFRAATEFRDGLARFETWETIQCLGLDPSGAPNMKMFTVDDAPEYAFQMHYPAWETVCRGGRFGFVDHSGHAKVAPTLLFVNDFSEGRAAFQDEKTFEYGYIDKSGTAVIKAQFVQARPFSEGLAPVTIGKVPDQKNAVIDQSGRFVIPPKLESIGDFSEGLAVGCPEVERCGFIDRNGTFVVPPIFESAYGFSEGLAVVWSNPIPGPYFVNKKGQTVFRSNLWTPFSFSDGLTVAGTEGTRVYLNRSGKIVAPYDLP